MLIKPLSCYSFTRYYITRKFIAKDIHFLEPLVVLQRLITCLCNFFAQSIVAANILILDVSIVEFSSISSN